MLNRRVEDLVQYCLTVWSVSFLVGVAPKWRVTISH